MSALIILLILITVLTHSNIIIIPQNSPSSALFTLQAHYRQMVAQKNAAFIEQYNSHPHSFQLKANSFISLTQKQFNHLMTTSPPKIAQPQEIQLPQIGSTIQVTRKAEIIDWRAKGYVTSVKDQGKSCAACYAFTAAADLQTSFLIKFGISMDFSEQQLIDCSSSQGNKGCTSGHYIRAFDFIKENGIIHQSSYPFTGSPKTCLRPKGIYKIKEYARHLGNSCSKLMELLRSRPVLVSLSALDQYWQFYSSGILSVCGQGPLNHGVQVTGVFDYGNGTNYYEAKNSWGVGWGMQGYIRIDRNIDNGNLCQICSFPSHSTI